MCWSGKIALKKRIEGIRFLEEITIVQFLWKRQLTNFAMAACLYPPQTAPEQGLQHKPGNWE